MSSRGFERFVKAHRSGCEFLIDYQRCAPRLPKVRAQTLDVVFAVRVLLIAQPVKLGVEVRRGFATEEPIVSPLSPWLGMRCSLPETSYARR